MVKKPLALNEKYFEDVMKPNATNKDNLPLFEKGEPDKFWLKLMGKTEKGKIECTGQVRVQVNVLPISVAEKNPVGKAQ